VGSPAVFLDRDGTINEDTGYVSDPEDLIVLPGAAEAIKRLNERGIKVIVITNQSGVGRGYYTANDVRAVNERLEELLLLDGARLDGIYYCPHSPDQMCGCRKPETGLIVRAAAEHEIDLKRSFVVGDKAADVEMAKRAEAKGILVLTGKGAEEEERLEESPDFVAKDILDAIMWILEDMKAQ
jgi:D-glycero-D-manno-heptose 1,7-bisphosphate phosphatase